MLRQNFTKYPLRKSKTGAETFSPTFYAHVCRYASKMLGSNTHNAGGTAKKNEMSDFHQHENGDWCERITEKRDALTKSEISCYTNWGKLQEISAIVWNLEGNSEDSVGGIESLRGFGLSPSQGPTTASTTKIVGKLLG